MGRGSIPGAGVGREGRPVCVWGWERGGGGACCDRLCICSAVRPRSRQRLCRRQLVCAQKLTICQEWIPLQARALRRVRTRAHRHTECAPAPHPSPEQNPSGLMAAYPDAWRRLHPDDCDKFTVWDTKTSARPFNRVGPVPSLPFRIDAGGRRSTPNGVERGDDPAAYLQQTGWLSSNRGVAWLISLHAPVSALS